MKVKNKKFKKFKASEGQGSKMLSDSTNKAQKMESPSNKDSTCLEGMTAAELMMVKKLAGNDPSSRKKTLRKLKKWLTVLSQKVPDTEDCREMIEPNFVRVWKALFYCMWMADKPLPQEQLAESLSDLQVIFAKKTYPFLLFVEWFIRTMAREWSWIDKFRMDKFMMLFRRFLRKSLQVISERKWKNDILLGYLRIVAIHIFNRSPPKSKKKGVRNDPMTPAPLGFQIHFIDIFMEELAKVGGENLKFQKTLKILTVFIQELGYNSDDRLLDEIRERIFNHLMRQSDVGMDYEEQMANSGVETEEFADMDGLNEEDDDEIEEDEIAEDDDDLELENSLNESAVLDPRAGAVDVILPQLDIEYETLYKQLIEFGGQKDIKLKNRRILYSLASQFKDITQGKYPLALPEDNMTTSTIPRKEIEKAAKRLLEMDNKEGKKRKTKKERRREAKRKLNASVESVGSEDNSRYINDEELMDHVSDNYMSYLEDEIDHSEDVADGPADVEENVDKASKKKTKNRKRKYKTVVEVEADDDVFADDMNGPDSNAENINEDREEVILIKKPKLGKKRTSLNIKPSTPLLGKIKRLSELRTPTNTMSPGNSSPSSANKRRVSFVLARNLEHEHADYPESIARSPAIPFDKDKQPASKGLLKSPATPNRLTPVRRASAIDFF